MRASALFALLALLLVLVTLRSLSARSKDGPPLRARIDATVAASGAEVAVAYHTLDGRDELLVRPDDEFHAASTMKIPVMIELFRQADAGRFRLDDQVPVVNEFRSIVDGSLYTLSADDDSETALYKAAGSTRSYRTLCELMITESSNLATNILIDRLGVDAIRRTVTTLGADGMHVRRGVEDTKGFRAGLNNSTTARALLLLLDAIASSRAVSAEASREMVDILKRQRINDAIPAGLPPGTPVAHKTGNITAIYHDAAIVYGPRPYVLVVLVRGLADERASQSLIASLTRLVDAAARNF